MKLEASMAGEDSKPEKTCLELVGSHFTIGKIKIPMKIPEFKRSGIGLIAEFHGILNKFPNQGPWAKSNATKFCSKKDRLSLIIAHIILAHISFV
jgi:hypothetical protein